jgi:hypothetical protein
MERTANQEAGIAASLNGQALRLLQLKGLPRKIRLG